jgi:hypothetical protein
MLRPRRLGTLVLALTGLTAVAAHAQDSGAFLVRLGKDTTSVERFTLTSSGLEIDQVSRIPRTLRRHATITFAPSGAMQSADVVVSRVGAAADAPPVQRVMATFAGDSAFVQIKVDSNVRKSSAAVPAGTGIPVISGWTMYDMLSMRRAKSGADSLHIPMYYLGAPSLSWVAIRRLGKDSIDIENENDRYHAKIDREGRIQGARPIRGTQQYSIERQPSIDVNVFAAAFAMSEQMGGPAGQLSPRDTVNTPAAGATLWVDYGRPQVRGRTIFGGVVPWGEVWRTGANAATQFRTDKPLAFGSIVVPAGMYTLWTLPTKTGWTLLVNSQTGQWGTEHDPAKDLYRIPMSVETNPSVTEQFTIHIAPDDKGGQIHFVWDRTVAAVDFTVQQ